MLTKKLITEILRNQKEIKELLNPNTLEKSRKYEETAKSLSHIRLSVKSIKTYVDENARKIVAVTYEPITEHIIVYDDGEVFASDRFKAINDLNLISGEDMNKISIAIDKSKAIG